MKNELDKLQFFQTGEELIGRIYEAIRSGQSVLVTGPRGCGKTYCIERAIERAIKDKIIHKKWVFLQGNREIPRDYLAEDDIAFVVKGKQNEAKVIPEIRTAPLFAVAQRKEGKLVLKQHIDGQIPEITVYDEDLKEAIEKPFVLFLDEVNRFSDGVKDSLLSVLEEKKTVLAGEQYRIPVVVCMSMNPPGYDVSAGRLSPPLAARIGRCYRLYTPDLDTLADVIARTRLKEVEARYKNNYGKAFELFIGLSDEIVAKEREVNAAQNQQAGNYNGPRLLAIDEMLVRKVALITLCLWGEVRESRDNKINEISTKGHEYLTPATRSLLKKEVKVLDRLVAQNMTDIAGLIEFGPDARAVPDWLVVAIEMCISEAESLQKRVAILTAQHLYRTVLESISHKIYDNFSPATRPDKTVQKEQCVTIIAHRILFSTTFDEVLKRTVMDADRLWISLSNLFPQQDGETAEHIKWIQTQFLDARVVNDVEVERWLSAAAENNLVDGLKHIENGVQILRGSKNNVVGDIEYGFTNERFFNLAQKLSSATPGGPLAAELNEILNETQGNLLPIILELEEKFDIFREIGVDDLDDKTLREINVLNCTLVPNTSVTKTEILKEILQNYYDWALYKILDENSNIRNPPSDEVTFTTSWSNDPDFTMVVPVLVKKLKRTLKNRCPKHSPLLWWRYQRAYSKIRSKIKKIQR